MKRRNFERETGKRETDGVRKAVYGMSNGIKGRKRQAREAIGVTEREKLADDDEEERA